MRSRGKSIGDEMREALADTKAHTFPTAPSPVATTLTLLIIDVTLCYTSVMSMDQLQNDDMHMALSSQNKNRREKLSRNKTPFHMFLVPSGSNLINVVDRMSETLGLKKCSQNFQKLSD
jgi:hypothetical protein